MTNYEQFLKRKGLSKSTVISYSRAINLYLKDYKWNFENACLWKEEQMQKVKPATVNKQDCNMVGTLFLRSLDC